MRVKGLDAESPDFLSESEVHPLELPSLYLAYCFTMREDQLIHFKGETE